MIIYNEKDRITYYDLGMNGKPRLSALIKKIQTAADYNARDLGIGYAVLAPLGISFVLNQFALSINSLPEYDQEVFISTWPDSVTKGTFLRKGKMTNLNGITLVEWASKWILFNINERRILRPKDLPAELTGCGDQGVKIMPEKVLIKEAEQTLKAEYVHYVSYSDCDTNMHMNNAVYADLIENVINLDGVSDFGFGNKVNINYQNEIRPGEEVTVRVFESGGGLVVQGKCGDRVGFSAGIL